MIPPLEYLRQVARRVIEEELQKVALAPTSIHYAEANSFFFNISNLNGNSLNGISSNCNNQMEVFANSCNMIKLECKTDRVKKKNKFLKIL